MNKLKTNIIIKSNSMKTIISRDIQNLTDGLEFKKQYNIIENNNENITIELLFELGNLIVFPLVFLSLKIFTSMFILRK